MADGEMIVTPRSTDALIDLAAERAVLAAVLLDEGQERAVHARVTRLVRVRTWTQHGQVCVEGDFGDHRHNLIFCAMTRVLDRQDPLRPLDVLTLTEELRALGCLHAVGGAQYLGEITDVIPTLAHCEAHARIVAELAVARRLHQAMTDGLALLRARGAGAVRDVLSTLASVRVTTSTKSARSMGDITESAWHQLEQKLSGRRRPVPTGFVGLDGDDHDVGYFAGGLHDGEVIVVAADQASGKTSFAMQVAVNAAERGVRVLVVSQEMSGESLHWRLAAARSGVPLGLIRAGRLTQEHLRALTMASGALHELPVDVVDAGASVDDVRAVALAKSTAERVGMVVVDYLQILDPPSSLPESEQHAVIDQNMRALKLLARELDCPVMVLSQFNRGGQADKGKPRLQHLKGSGGIESHADVVVVIYPTEGRTGGAPPPVMDVSLIILKQRAGPTGEVPLRFVRAETRFEEVVVRREGARPASMDDFPEDVDA